MASNPFYSGRIPQSLFDAVEAYREQTAESKTDVLTRALAKYIAYELDKDKQPVPPIQEKLDEIFNRLSILEKQSITVDNREKNTIKQLEITSDKGVINSDIIKEITGDNKSQILSTKDAVALLGKGTSPSTLARWKKENKLPKEKNGYRINNKSRGKWIITKIDNTDN